MEPQPVGDSRSRWRVLAVVAIVVVGLLLGGWWLLNRSESPRSVQSSVVAQETHTSGKSASSSKRTGIDPVSGLAWIAVDALPKQARETLARIDKGGPFPYDKDGVVFDNRERILPLKPSGYYHEYTVVTPGAGDRGARRIITGKGGEFYWTADHYAHFSRIDR